MNCHSPTTRAAEIAIISIALIVSVSVMALTPTRSADINPYAARTDVHTLASVGAGVVAASSPTIPSAARDVLIHIGTSFLFLSSRRNARGAALVPHAPPVRAGAWRGSQEENPAVV